MAGVLMEATDWIVIAVVFGILAACRMAAHVNAVVVVVLTFAFIAWVAAYTYRVDRDIKARQREVRGILRELERLDEEESRG